MSQPLAITALENPLAVQSQPLKILLQCSEKSQFPEVVLAQFPETEIVLGPLAVQ
jgi:hypothetical protein